MCKRQLVVCLLGGVEKRDMLAVNVNILLSEVKLSGIVGIRAVLVIGTFFAKHVVALVAETSEEYGVQNFKKGPDHKYRTDVYKRQRLSSSASMTLKKPHWAQRSLKRSMRDCSKRKIGI